jgi:zinc/manganese transport system ATP-binding protein
MPDVTLRDLTLGYDRHPAVSRLSGRFEAGSLTAVVGPNGSGKSTLLKAIAGHVRPLAGSIDRGGLKAAQIAYLPQAHGLDLGFPLIVADLIALGFMGRRGLFGGLNALDRNRMAAAMAAVGLDGLGQRPIGSLSGGQLQRALFARVLVQEAQLVLLDEPFTGIDARAAEDLAELMAGWPAQGRTVIAVLHDLDLARRLCPQTLVLAREQVAWGPSDLALAPEPLARARRLSRRWSTDEAALAAPRQREPA